MIITKTSTEYMENTKLKLFHSTLLCNPNAGAIHMHFFLVTLSVFS